MNCVAPTLTRNFLIWRPILPLCVRLVGYWSSTYRLHVNVDKSSTKTMCQWESILLQLWSVQWKYMIFVYYNQIINNHTSLPSCALQPSLKHLQNWNHKNNLNYSRAFSYMMSKCIVEKLNYRYCIVEELNNWRIALLKDEGSLWSTSVKYHSLWNILKFVFVFFVSVS